MKVLTQKKYQSHVSFSFAYKLICVDDEFTKPIVIFRCKNTAYKFIESTFKEFEFCKKVMKKYFNKNLIMSEKQEEQFQSSNIFLICEKLIDNDNEKVRDHCRVTEKLELQHKSSIN